MKDIGIVTVEKENRTKSKKLSKWINNSQNTCVRTTPKTAAQE